MADDFSFLNSMNDDMGDGLYLAQLIVYVKKTWLMCFLNFYQKDEL